MQALIKRSSGGGSYNVDTSLTQFNNWYIRDQGLHSQETQASLRAMHPYFHPRHDSEIFELITMTMETTKASHGFGAGKLWDPARFTTGPIRWGKDGEVAKFLDWRRIVTVTGDSGKTDVVFGFKGGSCMPGSDLPVWL
jgi:hypothetical protein